jgi:hypothetical protein
MTGELLMHTKSLKAQSDKRIGSDSAEKRRQDAGATGG